MTNALVQALASCLLDQLYQIEVADEGQIDEDFSVNLMEVVGAEFQSLPPNTLSELLEIVTNIASSEQDGGRKDYLESFAENFGLDNRLA